MSHIILTDKNGSILNHGDKVLCPDTPMPYEVRYDPTKRSYYFHGVNYSDPFGNFYPDEFGKNFFKILPVCSEVEP